MGHNLDLNELKIVQSISLYKQVEAQLSNLFSNSNLRPGDKIPSERELQEHLGVSRSVLREALRILEAKGLIEGRQGKGRFIRSDVDFNSNASFSNLEKITLSELYETRIILEPEIAKLAAQKATESDIANLESALNKMDPKDEHADFSFHLALAKASHNRMALRMMQLHLEIQVLYSNQLFDKVKSEYSMDNWIKDHEQILDAVKKGNGDMASQVMLHHLKKSFELIK